MMAADSSDSFAAADHNRRAQAFADAVARAWCAGWRREDTRQAVVQPVP